MSDRTKINYDSVSDYDRISRTTIPYCEGVRNERGYDNVHPTTIDKITFTKLETLIAIISFPIGYIVERISDSKTHKEIRQMRRLLGLPSNEKELVNS